MDIIRRSLWILASFASLAMFNTAIPSVANEPEVNTNLLATGKIDLGILPQLVGRSWETGQGYKATVTIAEDGRYKFKSGGVTFYINPGIATAPSTKVSYAGHNLSEASFESGPNGLILTEDRGFKFRTYLFLTPKGDLRLVTVRRGKEGTELLGFSEYVDPANLQPGQKAAEKPRIYGKKMGPELEALLGVKMADLGQLVHSGKVSPTQLAAEQPASQPATTRSSEIVAFSQNSVTSPEQAANATPTSSSSRDANLSASLAQKTSTAIDQKAAVQRFGTLATLINTVWAVGQDEIVEIKWDRPGEGILILRQGLYGPSETYVAPSSDGKSLRYVRRNVVFGDTVEGTTPIASKGQFYLRASASQREQCKLAKAVAQCMVMFTSGDKWFPPNMWPVVPTWNFALSQIAKPQAVQVLANIKDQFPDRPRSEYHSKLGILADISGTKYRKDYYYVPIIDAGSISNETWLVTQFGRDYRNIFMTANGSGNLTGNFSASSSKNPQATGTASLFIDEGGAALVCSRYFPFGELEMACDTWRLTADGGKIMLIRAIRVGRSTEVSRQYFEKAPEFDPRTMGLLATLDGKVFQSKEGSFIDFNLGEPGAAVSYRYDEYGQVTRSCILYTKNNSSSCSNVSGSRPTNFSLDFSKDLVVVDGRSLTLRGAQLVMDSGTKNEAVWAPVSRGFLAMAKQAAADSDRIALSYNVREQDKRDRQEFWAGVSRRISQMDSSSFANNTWKASTPADWGASANGSGGRGAPGYEGLSVSRTVKTAPMTPTQRAQQDEYQRMKIREELYGGSRPVPSASSGRSVQDLRDEHAAGYQKIEEEYAAKDTADRAQMDAKSRADAVSYEARQKADYDRLHGKGASSTSGGKNALIVTDGRNPQADAEAERRQQAINAAGDAQRKATADAALAYEKAQEEESKRIAAENKRKAGPEDACERSRRLAREAIARGEKAPGSAVCM